MNGHGLCSHALSFSFLTISACSTPLPPTPQGLPDLKQLVGANWVDPPKRERKRVLNYSEADYYKNALKTTKAERQTGPKMPKMPALQDFQFFNTRRLHELYEKENFFEMFKHQQAQKEQQMRSQGASDETIAKELVPPEDAPQPLTEEELAEREKLHGEGFTNWSRRDFNAFVRACEKYGREALPQIAAEIDGKTEEEVGALGARGMCMGSWGGAIVWCGDGVLML